MPEGQTKKCSLALTPREKETEAAKHIALVAQLVNNLPAMQETWIPSLGQEDTPEQEVAAHSSMLP